ncbi:hypothetical protein STRAU_2417 [Streptomyces aurantiacus JA 4570]|uniref:Uncharacterized protein n=1 Tax=Streptomyces aurantiacus JA 4570 TaxID=1286094 RepID=S4A1H5_9ACTN|nr:hypothetical protein STRAU_2417 [Streptomyces aurantiacus JA 4570]
MTSDRRGTNARLPARRAPQPMGYVRLKCRDERLRAVPPVT